jgi:hypothetical protein
MNLNRGKARGHTSTFVSILIMLLAALALWASPANANICDELNGVPTYSQGPSPLRAGYPVQAWAYQDGSTSKPA